MYASALAFVLLSAVLHASWNAQLQSGKNQAQFMASMCLAVGSISLVCVPIVGLPGAQAWPWIALSGVLHILYNFLLLQKYKKTNYRPPTRSHEACPRSSSRAEPFWYYTKH